MRPVYKDWQKMRRLPEGCNIRDFDGFLHYCHGTMAAGPLQEI
jgi:hypothetical protein